MPELSCQQQPTLTNYQWLEDHHLIKTHHRAKTLQQLNFPENSRILDAACGPGFWAEMMATSVGEDGRVVGVDVNADLIAEANIRKNAGVLRDRIEFLDVDLQEYEPSAPFTDVVCFNCLPYFNKPELVVKRLKQFVGPAGRLHLKETDMNWSYFSGMDHDLYQRALVAAKTSEEPVDGALRYDGFFGAKLYQLMSVLEPKEINISVGNVHFWAPFSPKQLQYVQLCLDSILSYAEPTLDEMDRLNWEKHSNHEWLSSLPDGAVFGMSEIICTGIFD